MKMKNISHRDDVDRPKCGHGHKYSKYREYLFMTMLTCKQHLSSIWSSVHEKFKQHWGWVEKNVAYKKAWIPVDY